MNNPTVVWQRARLRIVAAERTTCEEHQTVEPELVLEECYEDALGKECWLSVGFDEGAAIAANLLLLEIAARNELMPVWVREFVEAQLAGYDEEAIEDEGTAS